MPGAPGTPGSPGIQNKKLFASPPPGSLPWLSSTTRYQLVTQQLSHVSQSCFCNDTTASLGRDCIPPTPSLSPSRLSFLQPLLPPTAGAPASTPCPLFSSGSQPCSHFPLPSLTFVTLGSLRAGWAWWSLQVKSKRTGAWRPTTQCAQRVGEPPAELSGVAGTGGAQHSPEPESPGRPRSPEGHSREGTVSCARLPLLMPQPKTPPPSRGSLRLMTRLGRHRPSGST